MRYDVRWSVDAPLRSGSRPGSAARALCNREDKMKRRTAKISVVLLLTILLGCGATTKMIQTKSQSERTDVFQEISGGDAIPAGHVELIIKASIKTHIEGYYGDESIDSAHGKETYPFLINIDGQAVLWRVKGEKHQLPKYVEGNTSWDPEAGNGMKYVLEKKVRLAAGTHKVFFGLPEEPYYTEADITMVSGNAYVLEFKPKYWHKHVPTRMQTFLKGIYRYEVYVNAVKVD